MTHCQEYTKNRWVTYSDDRDGKVGRNVQIRNIMCSSVINAVVLLATGVNGDGHREVLGMRVATSETGAAWNGFFADLVARGLAGVRLVTSDAHAGLVEAIAAHLPGATWQRCRTHYAANLMSICPKGMWPAVKAMLHSVYDQPDAAAVNAQFDRLLGHVSE